MTRPLRVPGISPESPTSSEKLGDNGSRSMDTRHAHVLPFEADKSPATALPPPAGLSQEQEAAGEEPKGASDQAVPAQPAGDDMSTPVLVQAGLTAFDAILLVMLIVMWQIDAGAVASVLRSATGTAFLIALAPVGFGVFLLHRNKKAETPEHGLIWAKVGIYVGMLLAMAVLMIPAIVTLRSLVSFEPV